MTTPSSPLPDPARQPARVLVVDPDAAARHWAAWSLRAEGHDVHLTEDADAIEQAGRRGFDLLIMDPNARAGRGTRHGFDAWQRLRGLRDQGAAMPVIVMQTASDSADRTVAFELGADAVVDKPFEPRELQARVLALLRRSRDLNAPEGVRPAGAGRLAFGGWMLDVPSRRLNTPEGHSVNLSHAECRLLQAFLQRPHSALQRQELMDLARGAGVDHLDRSIDLLVSRLRHKLEDDPRAPRVIRTVRGIGYLFAALDVEPGLGLPADMSSAQPS